MSTGKRFSFRRVGTMKVKSVLRTMSIVLACNSTVALGDATVWTNGNGLGGATLRATGADGVTATATFTGTGQSEGLSSPDGSAGVFFTWGADWLVMLDGAACSNGASFGDGGAAHCMKTSLALSGSFEPEGSSGTEFGILGSGGGGGFGEVIVEIHYALLGVHPSVIPEGTIGKASDLVEQGIIAADDVLFEFFASNEPRGGFDFVKLGQKFGRDDLTVLGWIHGVCVRCEIPAASTWGLAAMTLLLRNSSAACNESGG